ncbi:uncharacterized protein LOC8032423 [Ixodes scapularis]|uniref:uncharacterized protein LOC8032423 n=1 Tax=Ixodes scapularis TaxID=6945 RepID=UPI001AD667BE|nr:uncharacterized protein LOC8032423 [Ixodes scapularis]
MDTMRQNYGAICGETPTDPSTDWLERFRRERRKRKNMKYCYKGLPSLEAAGYQSIKEPLPGAEDAMVEPNNVHGNHNHEPVQGVEALSRTNSSAVEDLHRDKLLSGLFRDADTTMNGSDEICNGLMTVNHPELRSAPLVLVFSSLYAIVLHVTFMATSWWLVHEYFLSGCQFKAATTLFLSLLSSLPLFINGIIRLLGRENWPTYILSLVLHVLAAGIFNMVPLLQLILRLGDSIWLYRSRGRQDQAALLKRHDRFTFANVMFVVTLSCFPQAVFQTSETLKLLFANGALQGPIYLQAVNTLSAILLTGFGCIKFEERPQKTPYEAATARRAAKALAEHGAWLLVMSARTLSLAILLAKAPEPSHVIAVFFGITVMMEFLRARRSGQLKPPIKLRYFVDTLSRAVVVMFFRLRDRNNPPALKLYVVFLITQFTQSLFSILLPFFQEYGLNITSEEFNAYYFPSFATCIWVHYGLLVPGGAALIVWFRLEKSMECSPYATI